MPRKTGYLPSLDGWRALAILGVLMAHDLPWVIAGHSNVHILGYGGYGVQLFFAISGVLITTRILEEESLVGFFDIRKFYIRRIFRIQPASLAYLAVTGLLITFGVIHDHWFFWLGSVFLYQNFAYRGLPLDARSFFSGHFWTLAVEEHFYILLSLLLFVVRKYRLALFLTLYVGSLMAGVYAVRHGYYPEIVHRRTYWNLHFLLFPAAFAIALRKISVLDYIERYLRPWVAASLWALALLYDRAKFHHHHPGAQVFSVLSTLNILNYYPEVFFTLMIVSTMLHPRAWATRVLEWGPLRFIGKISYSLYLWHVLFFFRIFPGTNITNPILLALSGRPAKYIVSLSAACLSYYLLEKPMMRLGHRLAPPMLAGRPELLESVSTKNERLEVKTTQ